MRVNVEKVLERDQKLSEIDRRADELQVVISILMGLKASLKCNSTLLSRKEPHSSNNRQ